MIRVDVEKISIPRASGTENNQKVREYIKSELIKAGLIVKEQRFRNGVNIIASSGDIVLGCHYDSIGPGADDNASGVAVVLDVAKKVKGITFVFFDAEERGLLGSKYYVKTATCKSMINLDMIGNLKGRKVESIIVYGRSDHMSFIRKGIPASWLFTGTHSRYHTKRDTPDTLDYDGLDKISSYLVKLLKKKRDYILLKNR